MSLETEVQAMPGPPKLRPAAKHRWLSLVLRECRRSYSVVILLALWEALPRLGVVNSLFLPPFTSVISALYQGLFETGVLASDTWATVQRAFTGLVIGCFAGVLVGALMSQFRVIDDIVERPMSLLFPTPKLALFPLFTLWLGLGDASKIAIVAVTVFFPMCVNTYAGMKGVDKYLIWNARTKGATAGQILRRVALPAAVPFMLAGLRISTSFSLLVVIAVEMFSASNGLGYRVVLSQSLYEPAQMFAAIMIVSILGFLVDRLVGFANRRLLAWQEK